MVMRLIDFWSRQAERVASQLDLDEALPDVFEAFDTDAEAAQLAPLMQAHMQRVAVAGAWEILQEWNPESSGWEPGYIESWISKAAATNSVRWAHAVEKSLSTAALKEDPVKAISGFLDGRGPSSYLAQAFATEAASFGRQDAAVKSGLDRKTWIAGGENPRPEHAALNGISIPINNLFENGQRWPGDFTGDSASSAACTCILRYGKE